jgi:hypothetical protein
MMKLPGALSISIRAQRISQGSGLPSNPIIERLSAIPEVFKTEIDFASMQNEKTYSHSTVDFSIAISHNPTYLHLLKRFFRREKVVC